jgi:hypothetical protein
VLRKTLEVAHECHLKLQIPQGVAFLPLVSSD